MVIQEDWGIERFYNQIIGHVGFSACYPTRVHLSNAKKMKKKKRFKMTYFLQSYKNTCNSVNRKGQTNSGMCCVYLTAPLNPEDDFIPRRRLHISIRCCFSLIKRMMQSAACFSLARGTGCPCTFFNLSPGIRWEECCNFKCCFSCWSFWEVRRKNMVELLQQIQQLMWPSSFLLAGKINQRSPLIYSSDTVYWI